MVLLDQKYLLKTLKVSPTVKELILDDKEITEIGKLKLEQIEKLSLRNNMLENLDFTKYLPTLTDLNLSNNNIKRFPRTWEHEGITKLHLKGNANLDFKNIATFVPKLKKLWVDEQVAENNATLFASLSITHLNDTKIKKSEIIEKRIAKHNVTIESFVQDRKEVPKIGIYVPKMENEFGYSNTKDSGLVDKKTHKTIRPPHQLAKIQKLFLTENW
jgi:hypothetical protein